MTHQPFKRLEGKGIPPLVFAMRWENVKAGDTCQPLFIPYSPDKSIQVFGTWGGATVDFMGTNDPRVVTDYGNQAEDILKDTDQTDLSWDGTKNGEVKTILSNVLATYPVINGGDGTTNLTICVTSHGGK